MRVCGGGKLGFTLIELMLVSAIIGLLASIAIPKFGNLIIKSKESAIKGKLGALRSAITIYYSDNEGMFPGGISGGFGSSFVLAPKYMEGPMAISLPTVPLHKSGNFVGDGFEPDFSNFLGFVSYGGLLAGGFDFPWGYTSATGHVFVHCTHLDSTGHVWSTW